MVFDCSFQGQRWDGIFDICNEEQALCNRNNLAPLKYFRGCIISRNFNFNWRLFQVGLAVDDIKGVQEQAGLKRLAMQVNSLQGIISCFKSIASFTR